MDTDIFWKNLYTNIYDTAIFTEKAQEERNLKERSRYYKAAYLLAASNTEAFLYHLVKNAYTNKKFKKNLTHTKKQTKLVKPLPKDLELRNQKGTQLYIGILEEKIENFKWDKFISFKDLIKLAEDENLINTTLAKQLDRVRIKRNKIHIQEATQENHKYTKRDVESTSKVMLKLIKKLKREA